MQTGAICVENPLCRWVGCRIFEPFSRGFCFSLIGVCFYRGHSVAVSLWV
jgi:hypothetical protein